VPSVPTMEIEYPCPSFPRKNEKVSKENTKEGRTLEGKKRTNTERRHVRGFVDEKKSQYRRTEERKKKGETETGEKKAQLLGSDRNQKKIKKTTGEGVTEFKTTEDEEKR